MSLFAPDGMLVVTPPPLVGESVFGYILRLSEKNGYATPWHLFAVAGVDQARMFRVTVPPERLAAVLGRPTAEIESLPWYRFPTGEPMPAFNIGTSRFRRSMDPRMRSKICPQCVRERGFLDASWELKVMVACPRHRTPLVTHCQACGNALSWFRPGMGGCRCGAAIAESSNVTISQPMADLLLGVQNCFFGTHQNAVSVSGLPIGRLAAAGIRNMLSLLSRLVASVSRMRSLQAASTSYDLETIDEVARLFEDWPHGLHRWMQAYETVLPPATGYGVTRHFDQIYGHAIKPHRDCYPWVLEAFLGYGARKLNSMVLRAKTNEEDRRQAKSAQEDRRRYVIALATRRSQAKARNRKAEARRRAKAAVARAEARSRAAERRLSRVAAVVRTANARRSAEQVRASKQRAMSTRVTQACDPLGPQVMTLTAAAKALGVQQITARAWAQKCLFGMELVPDSPKGLLLVKLPPAPPKKDNDAGVELRSAAAQLGLPVSVLVRLRRDGAFSLSHVARYATQFHAQHIREIRALFLARAPIRLDSKTNAQMTVRELNKKRFGSKENKYRIYKALIDGTLDTVGRIGDDVGDIVLDIKSVFYLGRSVKQQTAGIMSASTAGELLSCTSRAIGHLWRGGHLIGHAIGHHIRVTSESVAAFAERYVSCNGLAKQTGTASRCIRRVLTEHEVPLLIVGSTREQMYEHFCLRSDVPAVALLGADPGLEPPNGEKQASSRERLERYLSGLRESKSLLPRRAGKPNLSAIAAACGFSRDSLYDNKTLVAMLAAHDAEEMSRQDTEVSLDHISALFRYLERSTRDNVPLPTRGGKPNLRSISKACGFNRNVFYNHKETMRMLLAHTANSTAV